MTEKQGEIRWFLIKHKICGAIFTLNRPVFSKHIKKHKVSFVLCPNCGETVFNKNQVENFFNWLTIEDELTANATIRDIAGTDVDALSSLRSFLK